MDFSTGISTFDRTYDFNAIDNYNQFLKNNTAFHINNEVPTDFEALLENASKSYPLKDKEIPQGLNNFASQVGNAFSNSLNAVNNNKLYAERLAEDVAMGGPTSIHDAMIAAEKAELSLQMAVQVRNRIISAYTDITGMMI